MNTITEERVMQDEQVINEENTDVIKLWEPLKFDIDENYEYIPKGKIFNFFSNILYNVIALPVLKILTKIIYDLKIEGIENIRDFQGGAVTVSNHVLILDCAMVGIACGFRKVYYTTREGSFKIPFVRKLIKLLRAVPIPSTMNNKKYFTQSINQVLHEGKLVHFYPEAALWPYCEKIRNFKYGAFNFAVQNNVPIIPMVFKFREPKGFRKLFKKKPDVTLVILKPILTEYVYEDRRENEELLRQKVHEVMQNI